VRVEGGGSADEVAAAVLARARGLLSRRGRK